MDDNHACGRARNHLVVYGFDSMALKFSFVIPFQSFCNYTFVSILLALRRFGYVFISAGPNIPLCRPYEGASPETCTRLNPRLQYSCHDQNNRNRVRINQ